jgi:MFS superfamily sulfate permease-like transporter
MKYPKSVIIQALFVSLLFFLPAHFFYAQIFSFFEPEIEGITFQIISADRTLKTSFLFSVVAGLIPLISIFFWQSVSMPVVKRFISSIIILACISFAIFARHMAVKHYFNSIVSKLLAEKNTKNFLYPIDPRNFVYKIIIGFCAGCLISCLLLIKKRQRKNS